MTARRHRRGGGERGAFVRDGRDRDGLTEHDFLLSQTTWPADAFPGGTVAFRADCYRALQRLCESGIGVALLPVFMAEESGTLVRLPSHTADVAVDIWALLHRELGQSTHVRALLDFLQAALHRLAPSATVVPAPAGRRGVSRAGRRRLRGLPPCRSWPQRRGIMHDQCAPAPADSVPVRLRQRPCLRRACRAC